MITWSVRKWSFLSFCEWSFGPFVNDHFQWPEEEIRLWFEFDQWHSLKQCRLLTACINFAFDRWFAFTYLTVKRSHFCNDKTYLLQDRVFINTKHLAVSHTNSSVVRIRCVFLSHTICCNRIVNSSQREELWPNFHERIFPRIVPSAQSP